MKGHGCYGCHGCARCNGPVLSKGAVLVPHACRHCDTVMGASTVWLLLTPTMPTPTSVSAATAAAAIRNLLDAGQLQRAGFAAAADGIQDRSDCFEVKAERIRAQGCESCAGCNVNAQTVPCQGSQGRTVPIRAASYSVI